MSFLICDVKKRFLVNELQFCHDGWINEQNNECCLIHHLPLHWGSKMVPKLKKGVTFLAQPVFLHVYKWICYVC